VLSTQKIDKKDLVIQRRCGILIDVAMLLERLTNQAEHVELSIPCMSEYVGVIRLTVSGIATRMNFSVEEIEDIKIAVSEACTNAVQYAYDTPQNERIHLTFHLFPDKLSIVVKDTGKGFDIDALSHVPIDERTLADIDENVPRLGLGLTFIKNLMDDTQIVSVPGEGTTITMAKHTS
jgi:serine/threonine-protein kinase RsbW